MEKLNTRLCECFLCATIHKRCVLSASLHYWRGWQIQILKDIGSGLNENRKNYRKLLELAAKGKVSKVIVTYPDRLTRFGFKTLEFFFKQHGAEIIVLNEKDKTPREELIEDLITIISHFAGKLYGMRSHKYKKLRDGVKELIGEVEVRNENSSTLQDDARVENRRATQGISAGAAVCNR